MAPFAQTTVQRTTPGFDCPPLTGVTEIPAAVEPEQTVPFTNRVASGRGELVGTGVGPGTVGFGQGLGVGEGVAVGPGVGVT
jgi:hypothetical protein